jgi:hypothetical protein
VFVLSLIFLLITALFSNLFRIILSIEIFSYLTVILIATIPESSRHHDFRYGLGVGAAIITMHVSWGAGFLWSMVKSMVGK